MQDIKFSVIIPSYHSDKEVLVRTIKSILNQSYIPYEIILVDDNGSIWRYQLPYIRYVLFAQLIQPFVVYLLSNSKIP